MFLGCLHNGMRAFTLSGTGAASEATLLALQRALQVERAALCSADESLVMQLHRISCGSPVRQRRVLLAADAIVQ